MKQVNSVADVSVYITLIELFFQERLCHQNTLFLEDFKFVRQINSNYIFSRASYFAIFSLVLKLTVSEQRQMYLTSATGSDCQTLPLGAPWTSVSAIECYLTCVDQFPDSCHSVVYNPDTLACTPGSTAFGSIETLPSSIPDANSSDAIYYLKQPVPACNASLVFFLLFFRPPPPPPPPSLKKKKRKKKEHIISQFPLGYILSF